MKKNLTRIIPIILILCIIFAIVVYFIWQSTNKKVTDIENQVGISTTLENPLTETSESGITGDNNACLLLTLDITKKIIGNEAILASQNPGICSYSSTNIDTSAVGILMIVVTKTNPVTAKEQFEQAKTTSYSGETEPVTGLNADDAYFANTFKQLSILKGDSWIIISGSSDKFANEKEISVATAKLVLK